MWRAHLFIILMLLPAIAVVGLYLNGPQWGMPWYVLLPVMALGSGILAVVSMLALSELLFVLEQRRLKNLRAASEQKVHEKQVEVSVPLGEAPAH